MSFVNDILSKFLGNKSQRDMKALMPYIEKIKAVYPQINALNNDELRERTILLKNRVHDAVADDEKEIQSLKDKVENEDPSIDEREKIYREIDKLEKEITERLEDSLNEVLPEAFSIMKETARRFNENKTITVTASEFDRDLAATHDFVEIDGDKAIYSNSWVAGGNMIV